MEKTALEIPTELLQAAKLSPAEARAELALRLYQSHRLNERQAVELAGDPQLFKDRLWQNGEAGRFDLDSFLDWASHDLKTPLNAVIGFTKVVLKGIDGPVNEIQSTDLTTAFNSGQRMLVLISQLVEIARLNQGNLPLSRSERNLAELLQEMTERWKNLNPGKPLAVEIQITDPHFQVDPLQLRQLIHYSLGYAALRIVEGEVRLAAHDTADGVSVNIHSVGRKNPDKMEMDRAMLDFLIAALVRLHGGRLEAPQETDDGLQLGFFLPR